MSLSLFLGADERTRFVIAFIGVAVSIRLRKLADEHVLSLIAVLRMRVRRELLHAARGACGDQITGVRMQVSPDLRQSTDERTGAVAAKLAVTVDQYISGIVRFG